MSSRYKAKKYNGKKYDEHRLIANAESLGFNIVVHHKDGNKLNNLPENLEVISRSEHCKKHGFGRLIRPTSLFAPLHDGSAICRRCSQKKAWSDFRTDKSWSHGKASICKQCFNAYKRQRRKEAGS